MNASPRGASVSRTDAGARGYPALGADDIAGGSLVYLLDSISKAMKVATSWFQEGPLLLDAAAFACP